MASLAVALTMIFSFSQESLLGQWKRADQFGE